MTFELEQPVGAEVVAEGQRRVVLIGLGGDRILTGTGGESMGDFGG
jgi:hypothetical protein